MNSAILQNSLSKGAFLAILGSVLVLAGCRSAKITNEQQFGETPKEKPTIVYVTDFGLVPGEIEDDKGVLSEVPLVKVPAKLLLYGQEPPTERAKQLVNLMSTSLVKDIEAKGYVAQRYNPETQTPTNGWLIRGMYTKVQEGNRLQRTLIGFGAGETDADVVVVFDDLSKGPPEPFCELDTKADSGKLPGTAPLLVLTPYGTAARFLLAGTDLEQNVRETAHKIADVLEQRVEAAEE